MLKPLLLANFLFISLFLNAQSMNTYINREEIVNRLTKYLHPDNLGVIAFYSSDKNDKIKDVNIEVIEEGPTKLNTNALIGIKEIEVSQVNPCVKKASVTKLNDGTACFLVTPGKDYQISVLQEGFSHQVYNVSWRELLLNKEVGLVVAKLDCINLSGILTLKNMQFDLTKLKLKLIDKSNKNETPINVNTGGTYSILQEYNKSYILEFYEGNDKKHSIELSSIKKGQDFLDIISKTKDFDFVIQEANTNKVIIPTKYWTNTDYQFMDFNKSELLKHFLNERQTDIKKGFVLQLSNYTYDYSKLVFSDQSKKEFDLLTQLMYLYPNMKVSVNVHTDAEGSVSYSQRFTYDIAEKISRYLTTRGIDKNRILSRGMGKSFPLDNVDGIKNRRVEVEVLEL